MVAVTAQRQAIVKALAEGWRRMSEEAGVNYCSGVSNL